MADEKPSLDAFASLAQSLGVRIEYSELKLMRDGYVRLQNMLARLPNEPGMFDEPALVFAAPKTGAS